MERQSIFHSWIKDYGTLVNKVCYFYAHDTEDFKDLRQECLINLWRSIGKFHGESAASTWIYRISINSCISYVRKNKKRGKEPIELHPELIAEDSQTAELTKELYALVNALGPIDKALILMWLDGMDYESIATVSGLNKSTLGTRLHRIKNKLIEMSNR